MNCEITEQHILSFWLDITIPYNIQHFEGEVKCFGVYFKLLKICLNFFYGIFQILKGFTLIFISRNELKAILL